MERESGDGTRTGSFPRRAGEHYGTIIAPRIRSPSGGEDLWRPRMDGDSFFAFLTAPERAVERRRIAAPYGFVISTR